MFTINDILARTRRQPFQPFRIVTTTGQTYDIRYPDQAVATQRWVVVPPNPASDEAPDQIVQLSITRIVNIEDGITAPPKSGGAASNGAA